MGGGKRRGCVEANVEDEGRLTGGWQLEVKLEQERM